MRGGGEGQEEEPEPQYDEDDFVVHVDREDADGVDDLNAGPGSAHAHVAIYETLGGGNRGKEEEFMIDAFNLPWKKENHVVLSIAWIRE